MSLRLHSLLSLLPLLASAGCALLPQEQGNLYDMRREAQIAYAANQDERAEQLLLGMTRAVPNDPEAWFYLGNLYARTNRPEQATQAYQKALMLNRGDARAWHNMGVVRLREAWASFLQAYSLAPADDPLQERLEALIGAMEKMPLEGFSRNAAKPADGTSAEPQPADAASLPLAPIANQPAVNQPASPASTSEAKK